MWFWLGLACTPAPDPPGPIATAGPDLLLITVDTLRADHLGAYGYGRATSPHIDALANEGSRFANAWTPRGLTWPSLSSMMTSWYPREHGVRLNGAFLSNAPTTLAEVLSSNGYSCAAIMTNAAENHWEGFSSVTPIFDEPRDSNAADRAIDWLHHHSERFFLWVHLTAPHDPWEKHPQQKNFSSWFYRGNFDGSGPSATRFMLEGAAPGDKEQALAIYDGEVAYSDQQIGRILEALGSRRSSTLVMISADHGEELDDHPPYLHHFASLYAGVMRVPWIVSQPGIVPKRVVEGPVDVLDVAPTLLDLLGIPLSPNFHGRSVRKMLEGEGMPEKVMEGELEEKVQIVRTHRWTYVNNPSGFAIPMVSPKELAEARLAHLSSKSIFPLPKEALFDRDQDPLELQNLSKSQPAELAKMRQLATELQRRAGRGSASPVDPALKERLEALGYWMEP